MILKKTFGIKTINQNFYMLFKNWSVLMETVKTQEYIFVY